MPQDSKILMEKKEESSPGASLYKAQKENVKGEPKIHVSSGGDQTTPPHSGCLTSVQSSYETDSKLHGGRREWATKRMENKVPYSSRKEHNYLC